MVALGGGREAQDYFVEDQFGAVALDALYQLPQADIFLRLFGCQAGSCRLKQNTPSKAALLDILQVCILLYNKEDALFALTIAANRAEALGVARFNRPTKALFALKGICAQTFDIFGQSALRVRCFAPANTAQSAELGAGQSRGSAQTSQLIALSGSWCSIVLKRSAGLKYLKTCLIERGEGSALFVEVEVDLAHRGHCGASRSIFLRCRSFRCLRCGCRSCLRDG
jgi:hypothetical protein